MRKQNNYIERNGKMREKKKRKINVVRKDWIRQ